MSLPPGSTPIVSMRDFGPVRMSPQHEATVIFPGRPRVPPTSLRIRPSTMILPSNWMRMSPACWLSDVTTTPPSFPSPLVSPSITSSQVPLTTMPGERWLFPAPTIFTVTVALSRIVSFAAPTSKIAFQVSAEPLLTHEKKRKFPP